MISRYAVSLNGIDMASLDSRILLTDISYQVPSIDTETFQTAQRNGGRIQNRSKDSESVTVNFAIRAYDISERQAICQAICTWAKRGGELQINDRPGQKLICLCKKPPAITSALKWTDTLEIKFTAYAQPYWQDILPQTISLSGTSGSGTLYVPGSAPETMVEVLITAQAQLTTIELTVGNYTIVLSGLNIASGNSIMIAYDDEMIQSIRTGSTSLLDKRSGADDLIAECGANNSVSFTANASCTVQFSARGLWE